MLTRRVDVERNGAWYSRAWELRYIWEKWGRARVRGGGKEEGGGGRKFERRKGREERRRGAGPRPQGHEACGKVREWRGE